MEACLLLFGDLPEPLHVTVPKAQKADWGPCPYQPKGKIMLAQTYQGPGLTVKPMLNDQSSIRLRLFFLYNYMLLVTI